MSHVSLIQAFEQADTAITQLERALKTDEMPALQVIVSEATALVKRLITAYIEDVGESAPPGEQDDLLESFKLLVKGDPSWNTIRDNCRELLYYQNC